MTEPKCSAHAAPVVAPCGRCGVFLCALETHLLDGVTWCAACVVRPDVDVLGPYRLQFWGKRSDAWSWFFGAGALACLSAVVIFAVDLSSQHTDPVPLGFLLLLGAMQLAWFSRRRWARFALPVAVVITSLCWLASAHRSGNALSSLPLALLGWAIVALAFVSVPAQLFFELEVPREKLRRDWRRYQNNWLAPFCVLLALMGLFTKLDGFACLVAFISGFYALQRTRRTSSQPIRGKWFAIAGIVLSANGLAIRALQW